MAGGVQRRLMPKPLDLPLTHAVHEEMACALALMAMPLRVPMAIPRSPPSPGSSRGEA